MNQLRDVARARFTVVLVTHEEDIGEACDRIIRIRDGSVVSDGFEDGYVPLSLRPPQQETQASAS